MKKTISMKSPIKCMYCGNDMVIDTETLSNDVVTLFKAKVVCFGCNHSGPEKIGTDYDACVKLAERVYVVSTWAPIITGPAAAAPVEPSDSDLTGSDKVGPHSETVPRPPLPSLGIKG